ncbi:uncharacterized protein LOC143038985 [Oratosquilla oratoria]|uniref:uncharacterized protein LOC143038985 n=1 Tax=Oratosquilla oratoria TaxID=337810 RepID=UPI003F7645A9
MPRFMVWGLFCSSITMNAHIPSNMPVGNFWIVRRDTPPSSVNVLRSFSPSPDSCPGGGVRAHPPSPGDKSFHRGCTDGRSAPHLCEWACWHTSESASSLEAREDCACAERPHKQFLGCLHTEDPLKRLEEVLPLANGYKIDIVTENIEHFNRVTIIMNNRNETN